MFVMVQLTKCCPAVSYFRVTAFVTCNNGIKSKKLLELFYKGLLVVVVLLVGPFFILLFDQSD